MGAHNFIEFSKGKTAEQAFDILVSQAEWEYGHDPYNSTISTTRLVKKVGKVASKWSDDARRLAFEVADADGWGEKWESRAIDCGKTEDGMRMWAFYGWAAC